MQNEKWIDQNRGAFKELKRRWKNRTGRRDNMAVCLEGRGTEGSGDTYLEKEDELKQISWNLACAERPGFNLFA
jgi:hypothetical protein